MNKMRIIYVLFICIFVIVVPTEVLPADELELEKLEAGQFRAQPGTFGGTGFTTFETPFLSESIDVNKYILGPGDSFSIYVTGRSDLSFSVGIYPDGKIYIPVIGPVLAKGKTVNELKYILKKKFLKYYCPPLYFNVVINNLKLIKVNIIGQVNAPGIYAVRDGSEDTKKLINFLRLAGGFSEYADYDHIEITKSENGKTRRYLISYTSINEGNLTENVVLETGDVVFIPKRINTIYVLGQVDKPGAYNYTSESTILDFISQAGGLTKRSSNTINIIRREDGKNKIIKTNLRKLMKEGKYEDLEKIKPKDIIFVGKHTGFTEVWSGTLGFMNAVKYSLTVPRDTRDAWYDLTSPGRSPVTETSK